MTEFGTRGLNEVHVEAGFKLNGSLLREGCVDELLLYLAPMLVGMRRRGFFNLLELASLQGATRLDVRDLRTIGSDLRLIAPASRRLRQVFRPDGARGRRRRSPGRARA